MQGIEVPPFRAVGRLGGVGPSTVRISGLGGTVKGLWRRRKTEECWAPCSACEPGNQEFSPSQGEEGVSSESQPRSGVCFVWVGQRIIPCRLRWIGFRNVNRLLFCSTNINHSPLGWWNHRLQQGLGLRGPGIVFNNL